MRYVSGAAKRKEDCTSGTRDDGNDGKLPTAFRDEANGFIRQRRWEGHGVHLQEEHALLTMDEVGSR